MVAGERLSTTQYNGTDITCFGCNGRRSMHGHTRSASSRSWITCLVCPPTWTSRNSSSSCAPYAIVRICAIVMREDPEYSKVCVLDSGVNKNI